MTILELPVLYYSNIEQAEKDEMLNIQPKLEKRLCNIIAENINLFESHKAYGKEYTMIHVNSTCIVITMHITAFKRLLLEKLSAKSTTRAKRKSKDND